MYKLGLLPVFLFVTYIAFCQENEVSLFKLWNGEKALGWEDYRVTHEKKLLKTGFLVNATTSYLYKFIPGNWDVYDCVNVATLLVRGDSWVTDTTNLAVLEHERLHFDIAELYARKLRKELYALFTAQNKNYESYWSMLDSLSEVAQKYQEVYDHETFYGQMKNVQQLWKTQVSFELKKLEAYSFENMLQKCDENND